MLKNVNLCAIIQENKLLTNINRTHFKNINMKSFQNFLKKLKTQG